MAKCDLKIALDRADRSYAGGEKVTGTVEMHPDADVVSYALTLTREWRTHGRGNKTSGGAESVTLFRAAGGRAEAIDRGSPGQVLEGDQG